MTFLTPELRFNADPYHPNQRGNILLQFREKGYAVARGVFDPASVDGFRAQLESLVRKGPTHWPPYVLDSEDPILAYPARAPRLLDLLRGAFMPWIDEPQPTLFHPAWSVRAADPNGKQYIDWHKDADHNAKTAVHGGYTYPAVIHVNMYFEDTPPENGPTWVIPRSHRDPTLTPYADSFAEEPLACKKGDAVLWDQRLWHRGSARTVEGFRIVAIFGFYATPVTNRRKLAPAQRNAFLQAESETDKTLFGGAIDLG